MTKPHMALQGVRDGSDPLTVVLPFTTKAIGQSTPVAGATNTITVTMSTDQSLQAGDTVTISGLTGSQTSTVCFLAVNDEACGNGLLGGEGNWNQDTGTLKLTIADGQLTLADAGNR